MKDTEMFKMNIDLQAVFMRYVIDRRLSLADVI